MSCYEFMFVIFIINSFTAFCCFAGVSREVENLIQENNELLATKYVVFFVPVLNMVMLIDCKIC